MFTGARGTSECESALSVWSVVLGGRGRGRGGFVPLCVAPAWHQARHRMGPRSALVGKGSRKERAGESVFTPEKRGLRCGSPSPRPLPRGWTRSPLPPHGGRSTRSSRLWSSSFVKSSPLVHVGRLCCYVDRETRMRGSRWVHSNQRWRPDAEFELDTRHHSFTNEPHAASDLIGTCSPVRILDANKSKNKGTLLLVLNIYMVYRGSNQSTTRYD